MMDDGQKTALISKLHQSKLQSNNVNSLTFFMTGCHSGVTLFCRRRLTIIRGQLNSRRLIAERLCTIKSTFYDYFNTLIMARPRIFVASIIGCNLSNRYAIVLWKEKNLQHRRVTSN